MREKLQLLVIVFLSILLLVVLGLWVTRPSTAQAQSPAQWEYKTVRNFAIKDPDGGFGTKNGITEDGSPSTTKMLNDLGAQGWELVGFTAQGLGSSESVFIFKRHK